MSGLNQLVACRRMIILMVIFAIIFQNFHVCNGAPLLRAPSVFRSDEADMHKYSAVLAATEPFRLQCQQQLSKALNPVKVFTGKLLGRTVFEQGALSRRVNKAVDTAMLKFEQRMQNTLKAYGMTSTEFNSISSLLNEQKTLRKRVLLQAYFYKIAADLEMNLRKAMPTLPSISKEKNSLVKLPESSSSQVKNKNNNNAAEVAKDLAEEAETSSSSTSESYYTVDDSSTLVKRFARSLTAIENERIRLRSNLKKVLHIRELPPKMADPDYLPAMAPIVQKTCKEFPTIASDIIQEYGLHIEEFNALQDKLQKNFFFRYKVMNEINRIQKTQPF